MMKYLQNCRMFYCSWILDSNHRVSTNQSSHQSMTSLVVLCDCYNAKHREFMKSYGCNHFNIKKKKKSINLICIFFWKLLSKVCCSCQIKPTDSFRLIEKWIITQKFKVRAIQCTEWSLIPFRMFRGFKDLPKQRILVTTWATTNHILRIQITVVITIFHHKIYLGTQFYGCR